MEELAITTTIGMDGIPLASREAAIARMPSMIERQATAAIEESSVIILTVDGQVRLMWKKEIYFGTQIMMEEWQNVTFCQEPWVLFEDQVDMSRETSISFESC